MIKVAPHIHNLLLEFPIIFKLGCDQYQYDVDVRPNTEIETISIPAPHWSNSIPHDLCIYVSTVVCQSTNKRPCILIQRSPYNVPCSTSLSMLCHFVNIYPCILSQV